MLHDTGGSLGFNVNFYVSLLKPSGPGAVWTSCYQSWCYSFFFLHDYLFKAGPNIFFLSQLNDFPLKRSLGQCFCTVFHTGWVYGEVGENIMKGHWKKKVQEVAISFFPPPCLLKSVFQQAQALTFQEPVWLKKKRRYSPLPSKVQSGTRVVFTNSYWCYLLIQPRTCPLQRPDPRTVLVYG